MKDAAVCNVINTKEKQDKGGSQLIAFFTRFPFGENSFKALTQRAAIFVRIWATVVQPSVNEDK